MIGLSTEVLLKMGGTSSGTASGDWGQALGAVVSSCRNLEAGGAETGVGGTTVYEINVAVLETDSQEFPTAKEAIVSRYERLRSKHAPAGSQTFKRDATARECNASSYTVVAVEHADAAVQAFASERYPPGFALARPMLEAVVKQFMIGDYKSEDDGWQSIPDIRVNQRSLSRLAAHHPELSSIVPLWKNLSPVLNDFVHGGRGQLTSNPINESSEPRYPGALFWSVMLLYTMCVLLTSGWFWAHLGDEKRCRAILDAITKEDWGTLTIWRNGQEVRVVARGEKIS